jgi:hypothetical protein
MMAETIRAEFRGRIGKFSLDAGFAGRASRRQKMYFS